MDRTPLDRPRPPADMVSIDGLVSGVQFRPAPDLRDWIMAAYLDEAGPLYYPGHAHLQEATIGCVWTCARNERRGRWIVGEAEMPGSGPPRGGKWAAARREQQLCEWFGDVPDFMLTFDVIYADAATDANFCALVDHELCHCGQATDEFGQPAFHKTSGLPKYCIRGHSVEEFTSVVLRFGVEAAGQEAVDFVIAAAQKPTITRANLGKACGTCIRIAA